MNQRTLLRMWKKGILLIVVLLLFNKITAVLSLEFLWSNFADFATNINIFVICGLIGFPIAYGYIAEWVNKKVR